MDNSEKLNTLNLAFGDISTKLSGELSKLIPSPENVNEYRKQLSQLDKDIRRILIQRDMGY